MAYGLANICRMAHIEVMANRIHPNKRGARAAAPLSLRQIREAAGKTQVELAALLGTGQSELSRLERREDAAVSTIRKYAEALGARCEIAFVFPRGRRYVIAMGDPGSTLRSLFEETGDAEALDRLTRKKVRADEAAYRKGVARPRKASSKGRV